jgi:hypothetical protein
MAAAVTYTTDLGGGIESYRGTGNDDTVYFQI